jgi:hypothetical protein
MSFSQLLALGLFGFAVTAAIGKSQAESKVQVRKPKPTMTDAFEEALAQEGLDLNHPPLPDPLYGLVRRSADYHAPHGVN